MFFSMVRPTGKSVGYPRWSAWRVCNFLFKRIIVPCGASARRAFADLSRKLSKPENPGVRTLRVSHAGSLLGALIFRPP